MMSSRRWVRAMAWWCVVAVTVATAGVARGEDPRADERLEQFFADQVAAIEQSEFAGIDSAEAWRERREELVDQLREMLGLDPWPKRTPLEPEVRGAVEGDGFVVERVLFQSRPGLYVTANLYRPAHVETPLPAVLYVCGHSRQTADGVSFGNKTGYQHHGVWFARNGYVCLMIDTVQLGEIEGVHHGTHNLGQWWWAARGYTPAGAEAWNAIRAIDYLESRAEVDAERIGVTGRSGGGAYSWWVAALDQRVRVAVPVAGITDLRNHVVDDCIEGHCDCMYMVNNHRWDFGTLAALVAPRPLLISNSHRDTIFPLDGVMRVYRQAERIYGLLGAEDHLAVHVTAGPHQDTQPLRVGAFAWLNRYLKGSEDLIREPAEKRFEPAELRVLEPGELPDDQRVATVQEWFVPPATASVPEDAAQWETMRDAWLTALANVSGAMKLDAEACDAEANEVESFDVDGVAVRHLTAEVVPPLESHIILVGPAKPAPRNAEGSTTLGAAGRVRLCPCEWSVDGLTIWVGDAAVPVESWQAVAAHEAVRRRVIDAEERLVIVPPIGFGPTEWSGDQREQNHIRRRFHLLGMTADAVRVAELRWVLRWLESQPEMDGRQVVLSAEGVAAVRGLYASLEDPSVTRLELAQLPGDGRNGPILLMSEQVWDVPQLLAAASQGRTVRLSGAASAASDYLRAVAQRLDWQSVEIE